jgi:hypothetical protein
LASNASSQSSDPNAVTLKPYTTCIKMFGRK